MIIAGLDTETTGLDFSQGHRIIEIAVCRYDLGTRAKVDQFVQRFNPGRPIDAKAQAVHGISQADLVGMPQFQDMAVELKRMLATSDILVAHNMAFDAPFVIGELDLAGQELEYVDLFCTMEAGRFATFDGKSPKLQELCLSLGVDYDPSQAHAAQYDVERMMDCFFRGVDRGFFRVGPGRI